MSIYRRVLVLFVARCLLLLFFWLSLEHLNTKLCMFGFGACEQVNSSNREYTLAIYDRNILLRLTVDIYRLLQKKNKQQSAIHLVYLCANLADQCQSTRSDITEYPSLFLFSHKSFRLKNSHRTHSIPNGHLIE